MSCELPQISLQPESYLCIFCFSLSILVVGSIFYFVGFTLLENPQQTVVHIVLQTRFSTSRLKNTFQFFSVESHVHTEYLSYPSCRAMFLVCAVSFLLKTFSLITVTVCRHSNSCFQLILHNNHSLRKAAEEHRVSFVAILSTKKLYMLL